MSERGVIAIDRGVFDHECFADEPYTEREAWMWLISEAAWKARIRRIGNETVSLRRGQLAASVRFMAMRWGWSKSKVDRFLARLKNRDMIETKSGTGINTITIINYNTYQRVSLPSGTDTGTQSGTAAGQQRDKRENIESIEVDDDAPPRRSLISDEAFTVSEQLAEAVGFKDTLDWPPGWMGAPMRVQTWLNNGWPPEIILMSAREQMARKRDGPPDRVNYFEKGIAQAVANQSKPVPRVVVSQEPEVVYAVTQNQPNGSYREAKDRGRAAQAKLRAIIEAKRAGGDRSLD